MRRGAQHDRDRGAVAVWVAILMVPLMIIGALAIDVAGMHVDHQRLQTGADAAALAVAQDCARDECRDSAATAQSLAASNEPLGGPATATLTELDEAAGRVEVETRSERAHWFAPVVGIDDTALAARSAAAWGYPTGGPAVMPFAFSWCELAVQAGIPVIRDESGAVVGLDVPASGVTTTILSTKESDTGCTGPSGNVVPGGFGWLEPTDGCGSTVTGIDDWAPSSPGNAPSGGCAPSDFSRWIGMTTLLPVFDVARGTGENAEYHIFGYVGFTLEGYYFAGQYESAERPCDRNERCMRGTFERFVELGSEFEFSPHGPQLGGAVVELRLPEEG